MEVRVWAKKKITFCRFARCSESLLFPAPLAFSAAWIVKLIQNSEIPSSFVAQSKKSKFDPKSPLFPYQCSISMLTIYVLYNGGRFNLQPTQNYQLLKILSKHILFSQLTEHAFCLLSKKSRCNLCISVYQFPTNIKYLQLKNMQMYTAFFHRSLSRLARKLQFTCSPPGIYPLAPS